MSAKRILLLVFGSLFTLLGLAVTIGGVIALVAYGVGRDDDGYFTTSAEAFGTQRYALVSEEVDLGSEGDAAGPVSLGDLAEVRVRTESAGGRPIFVGIGPRSDVSAYLDGVAYDEVTDVEYDPFRVDYRPHPGAGSPALPVDQDFWEVFASGQGLQNLDWELESGSWSLVVMNADATPDVAADLQLGVKIKILLWLGVGLLVGGLVVLGLGAMMIVFGARGGGGGPPTLPPGDVPAPRHESPY